MPVIDDMTIRAQVMSGLFWTAGARLLSQAVTWVITIIVIRLLSPADYGLLAIAMVLVNFLVLLAEAGLGAAVVQGPEMNEQMLRRIFGAVMLIDGLLFLLQFIAAPAIAGFFEEDRLTLIIRVLGVQFLLMTFSVIPVALLTKRLDFKRQSLIDLLSALCGSLTTLGLAWAGYGVWAIVLGNLVAQLCKTVAINAVSPFLKWPNFSLSGLRSFITFGGQVTGARVLWFIYSQADVFIAGKLLGKEMLGVYSVAMHVASLPVQKISSVINQVAFPAFAQAQRQPETVPQYLLKAVRMLSFISFPLLWGISSISNEIVSVLLGPKWLSAALPLRMLPLVMPLSMLSPFFNTVFQGIGRVGVVVRNVLTASIIMPAAFLVGVQWGVLGLSLTWVIVFPLVFFLNLRRMLAMVHLGLKDVFSSMVPSVLASAFMYAAVTGSREAFAGSVPEAVLLALLIAVGVLAYSVVTMLLNRDAIREMAALVARPEVASA